jgi:prepilin-type N-terminal cleavage/methylation domain-containing protein
MKRIRYICLYIFSPDRRTKRSEHHECAPVHPNGGFTLLEVMTVVAVIAILSAIAVYSINTNLDRIRADTAVRRISFALNYARIRAVAENCNYIVTFAVRTGVSKDQPKCYISMLADMDKDGVKDAGEAVRTEDIPSGIMYDLDGQCDINNAAANSQNRDGIAFSDNTVTFLPRGNANESGEVYIIPEKSLEKHFNDNRRAVSLEKLSGRTIAWFYHSSLADAGENPWKEEGK